MKRGKEKCIEPCQCAIIAEVRKRGGLKGSAAFLPVFQLTTGKE